MIMALLIMKYMLFHQVAWSRAGRWSGKEKAAMLERVSRALSPLAFFIFNIAYWSYYLDEGEQ